MSDPSPPTTRPGLRRWLLAGLLLLPGLAALGFAGRQLWLTSEANPRAAGLRTEVARLEHVLRVNDRLQARKAALHLRIQAVGTAKRGQGAPSPPLARLLHALPPELELADLRVEREGWRIELSLPDPPRRGLGPLRQRLRRDPGWERVHLSRRSRDGTRSLRVAAAREAWRWRSGDEP